MHTLNSIRVAIKLPVILVTLSMLALVVTTAISYFEARASLKEQAEIQLQAIASARATAVETLVDGIERDIDLLAANPLLHEAILAFRSSLGLMQGDTSAYLADWYRARNPNGPDDYASLDAADDGSSYSRAHGTYHPFFRSLAERSSFRDIYLLDPAGEVIYSVHKDKYFATSVGMSGADAALGRAFAISAMSRGSGRISFVDFVEDPGSGTGHVAYASREIVGPSGRFLGVLVFQLPLQVVNDIMQDMSGFGAHGEAGEAFLFGRDGRLRSNSRLVAEVVLGSEGGAEDLQHMPRLELKAWSRRRH